MIVWYQNQSLYKNIMGEVDYIWYTYFYAKDNILIIQSLNITKIPFGVKELKTISLAPVILLVVMDMLLKSVYACIKSLSCWKSLILYWCIFQYIDMVSHTGDDKTKHNNDEYYVDNDDQYYDDDEDDDEHLLVHIRFYSSSSNNSNHC